MMMIPTLTLYRGATFDLPAEYLDDEGLPKPLTGVTITAWFQTSDGTVVPVLTPISNAAEGIYNYRQEKAVTATWPKGVWPLYVTYDVAGPTGSAETEIVTLLQIKDPG
jgi:hypothetical protein